MNQRVAKALLSNLYTVPLQEHDAFMKFMGTLNKCFGRRERKRSYSCFLFHPYGRGRLLSLLTLHGVAKNLCKAFKGSKFLENCLQTFFI